MEETSLKVLTARGFNYDYTPEIPFLVWLDIADSFLDKAFSYLEAENKGGAYVNLIRLVDLIMYQLPEHPQFYRIEKYERFTWHEIDPAVEIIHRLYLELSTNEADPPDLPFMDLNEKLQPKRIPQVRPSRKSHAKLSSVSSSGSIPIPIKVPQKSQEEEYGYEDYFEAFENDRLVEKLGQNYHSYELPLTPERMTFALTSHSQHSLSPKYKKRRSICNWDDEIEEVMEQDWQKEVMQQRVRANTEQRLQLIHDEETMSYTGFEDEEPRKRWYFFFLC